MTTNLGTTTFSAMDDFDAAKAVYEKLKELPRERQERVLRWVTEGLGISHLPIKPLIEPSTPFQDEVRHGIPQAGMAAATSAGRSSTIDIKTFISSKNPVSDVQFATAVAYYYRFEALAAERKESITGETLLEAARLSGRKRLSDPGNTLNNAKKIGYLDVSGRGEFKVNSVGENLVAMTLPGSSERNHSNNSNRKKPKAKKK